VDAAIADLRRMLVDGNGAELERGDQNEVSR